MTLLSIAQQIANETGFEPPGSIIGNNEDTARKLLAALQAAGKSLAKGIVYNSMGTPVGTHDWTALRKEQTFNTASGTQSYALSSIVTDNDFERFTNNTWWDRTNDRKLTLVNPQEWQTLVSGSITAGIHKYIIQRGGSIYFEDTPTSTDSIAFEYLSKNWCQSSGGSGKAAWSVDTDTGVIDEYLLQINGKWRFLQMVGLPYLDEREEAIDHTNIAIATDGGATEINIFRPEEEYPNIPDTGLT